MMTVCRKAKIGEDKRGVERGDEVMTKTAGEDSRQCEVLPRVVSTKCNFQFRQRILCFILSLPFSMELLKWCDGKM